MFDGVGDGGVLMVLAQVALPTAGSLAATGIPDCAKAAITDADGRKLFFRLAEGAVTGTHSIATVRELFHTNTVVASVLLSGLPYAAYASMATNTRITAEAPMPQRQLLQVTKAMCVTELTTYLLGQLSVKRGDAAEPEELRQLEMIFADLASLATCQDKVRRKLDITRAIKVPELRAWLLESADAFLSALVDRVCTVFQGDNDGDASTQLSDEQNRALIIYGVYLAASRRIAQLDVEEAIATGGPVVVQSDRRLLRHFLPNELLLKLRSAPLVAVAQGQSPSQLEMLVTAILMPTREQRIYSIMSGRVATPVGGVSAPVVVLTAVHEAFIAAACAAISTTATVTLQLPIILSRLRTAPRWMDGVTPDAIAQMQIGDATHVMLRRGDNGDGWTNLRQLCSAVLFAQGRLVETVIADRAMEFVFDFDGREMLNPVALHALVTRAMDIGACLWHKSSYSLVDVTMASVSFSPLTASLRRFDEVQLRSLLIAALLPRAMPWTAYQLWTVAKKCATKVRRQPTSEQCDWWDTNSGMRLVVAVKEAIARDVGTVWPDAAVLYHDVCSDTLLKDALEKIKRTAPSMEADDSTDTTPSVLKEERGWVGEPMKLVAELAKHLEDATMCDVMDAAMRDMWTFTDIDLEMIMEDDMVSRKADVEALAATEALVEGVVHVFHAAAAASQHLDLRDLVRGMNDRIALVLAVAVVCSNPSTVGEVYEVLRSPPQSSESLIFPAVATLLQLVDKLLGEDIVRAVQNALERTQCGKVLASFVLIGVWLLNVVFWKC